MKNKVFNKNMNLKTFRFIFALVLLPVILWALTEQEYNTKLMEIAKENNPLDKLVLIKNLLDISNEYEQFTVLALAAKSAFDAKHNDEAKNYAHTLLEQAAHYPNDWNYGNAIHDANIILGRIAAHTGNVELAAQYLLKAGNTPGSPQLNSFGPNMSLAKDLSDRGIKEPVIQYLELCKKFWKRENGRLERWITSIRAGEKPNYGMKPPYLEP